MRRTISALLALAMTVPLALAVPVLAPLAAKDNITDAQALAVVLADTRRDADRARDRDRHPAATLAFFRIKPGMTVVDYDPGGGWFTRVLVPYLGEKGRYIGLNPDVRRASAGMQKSQGGLHDAFPARIAGWSIAPGAPIEAWNSDDLPGSLNGKADRVLIMRFVHNLWQADLLRRELGTVRALLKDDGLLGIEQHRAKGKSPVSYTDGSMGYMREADVIALIEACGFELVGKSEINANRKDPANHARGVWMLPPNLSGVTDPAEKARLIEIGESDRMTLLFKKRR